MQVLLYLPGELQEKDARTVYTAQRRAMRSGSSGSRGSDGGSNCWIGVPSKATHHVLAASNHHIFQPPADAAVALHARH